MRANDLPLYYNAVDILERNLPHRADKVAIYSDDGQLTFGEISAQVNQVGHALRELGVRPGESVAILALDSPAWVAAYFGTIKIGAVAASFNTLLTAAEYQYMLADCRARVLIVHAPLAEKALAVRDALPHLAHIVVIGAAPEGAVAFDQWIAAQHTELATEPTHRDDFCCLNYSSGKIGRASCRERVYVLV